MSAKPGAYVAGEEVDPLDLAVAEGVGEQELALVLPIESIQAELEEHDVRPENWLQFVRNDLAEDPQRARNFYLARLQNPLIGDLRSILAAYLGRPSFFPKWKWVAATKVEIEGEYLKICGEVAKR